MAVVYRRATVEDAAGVAALVADPEVFGSLMQMPYESVAFWRKRLEAGIDQMDRLHLLAVDDDQIVGSAGIFPHGWSPRTRHVAGLGMSVRPSHQRRGIGAELMRRLLDWSDNWMGYLRIELDVYTDNLGAIALYEKMGFVNEGRMRMHALRNGVYVDSYRMARLHPRPPQHASTQEAR